MLEAFAIVVALLGIGIIIWFHELGHFLGGLLTDTAMEEFAVGLGPKIWQVNYRGILYILRILPLGGFVKFSSIEEELVKTQGRTRIDLRTNLPTLDLPQDKDRYMENKSPWQRLLILMMGPAFSIVLCPVCLAFALSRVGISESYVHSVVEGGPAQIAGMQGEDQILALNGERITNYSYLRFSLERMPTNKASRLSIQREGKTVEINLVPKAKDGKSTIGVMLEERRRGGSAFEYIAHSTQHSFALIKLNVWNYGEMAKGKVDKNSVKGPIGIIGFFAQQLKNGIGPFIACMGFISLSVGVMNLLPFPPLDGGRIVVDGFEAVTTKKLPKKAVENVTVVFALALLCMMIISTCLDLKLF